MNPRISEHEILKHKIGILLFGKAGITPKSKQDEILTDRIIELTTIFRNELIKQ